MRRDRLMALSPESLFRGYGEYFIRLLYVAWKSGYRLLEVPVFYRLRPHGESKSRFLGMIWTYTVTVFQMRFGPQDWAKEHFDIYPEKGYWSKTLTCVKNTRGVDVPNLIDRLAGEYNVRISNGYGTLKNETFRIAHMGDTQPDEIEGLLQAIDTILGL
jgi:hypothetical protein